MGRWCCGVLVLVLVQRVKRVVWQRGQPIRLLRSSPQHHHLPLPRLLQNGETAPDPLPEEKDNINGMQLLSMESTSVNQAFRQQVLPAADGGGRHALAEPCPADLAQEGCGYK